jgi:hypothetical protein
MPTVGAGDVGSPDSLVNFSRCALGFFSRATSSSPGQPGTRQCPVHTRQSGAPQAGASLARLSQTLPLQSYLTSTFGRIFLRLKQTHLEYNPIDLVLETYLFLVLLLAFLFLLKQSSEWHFLYRKS